MTAEVLVTGASSPLGEHVLPALLASGCRVSALARSQAAADRIRVHGDVKVLRHDLLEGPPPSTSAEVVVHLAGIRLADPAAALVQACGAERLVAVSSASAAVEGHPARVDVLRGEARLRAAGPTLALLRPTMIYGSARDRNVRLLHRTCQRLPAVPHFRGGGRIMPVYVEDVVRAVMEAMTAPMADGRPRAVGGPDPLRFGDLVDAVCDAADLRRLPVRLPVRALGLLAAAPGPWHGRTSHALQMLTGDRVVPTPAEEGFRYLPTPLAAGLAQAVRRYGACPA